MIIKTKYNNRDKVFYISGNRIVEGTVVGHQIILGEGEYFGKSPNGSIKKEVEYCILLHDIHLTTMPEELLFPTKEELLKNL